MHAYPDKFQQYSQVQCHQLLSACFYKTNCKIHTSFIHHTNKHTHTCTLLRKEVIHLFHMLCSIGINFIKLSVNVRKWICQQMASDSDIFTWVFFVHWHNHKIGWSLQELIDAHMILVLTSIFSTLTLLVGRQEEHLACKQEVKVIWQKATSSPQRSMPLCKPTAGTAGPPHPTCLTPSLRQAELTFIHN